MIVQVHVQDDVWGQPRFELLEPVAQVWKPAWTTRRASAVASVVIPG